MACQSRPLEHWSREGCFVMREISHQREMSQQRCHKKGNDNIECREWVINGPLKDH